MNEEWQVDEVNKVGSKFDSIEELSRNQLSVVNGQLKTAKNSFDQTLEFREAEQKKVLAEKDRHLVESDLNAKKLTIEVAQLNGAIARQNKLLADGSRQALALGDECASWKAKCAAYQTEQQLLNDLVKRMVVQLSHVRCSRN